MQSLIDRINNIVFYTGDRNHIRADLLRHFLSKGYLTPEGIEAAEKQIELWENNVQR
jgi:hypothetical protein